MIGKRGQIVLVTGGCRSGKSDYALQCGEQVECDGDKVFIATCPVIDDEIEKRIEKHKRERLGLGWKTLEEQVNLVECIEKISQNSVLIVDCLTLWVNNMMFHQGNEITEDDMRRCVTKVIDALRKKNITSYLVTNEVGMGLVPADSTNRLYRDLVGCCNREVAKLADQVILVCCGIPHCIKQKKEAV